MRGAIVCVADETPSTLLHGGCTADRGGVGHHFLHFRPGAVARVHRQERHPRQREAHLIGVMRRDAGGADFL